MDSPLTDPRLVPPLGWCSECIREGDWTRDATLREGNALCAQHVIFKYGPAELDPMPTEQEVLDQLRKGISRSSGGASF
jgi:hypothetical protein